MSTTFKISDAAAIALHAAVLLAARRGGLLNAGEISKALAISEAHLVKVLQRLTRAGIVAPERGRRGGYRLVRPPAGITLQEVYEAIEGRMPVEICLFRRKICKRRPCILHGLIRDINKRALNYFHETTLDNLAEEEKKSAGRPAAEEQTRQRS